MKAYLWFALKRAIQLVVVVFFGVSVAFFITNLSPIDPVQQTLSRITSRSNFSPEAIAQMREALTALYGVDGSLFEKYINFWRRIATGDLGPSLIAFPTPAMTLVLRALPWTVGLLTCSVVITWLFGNILGALAGYFQNNWLLKTFGLVAMSVQPIPYYIVAFVLLILFGFVWPVLPISGGFAMNVTPGMNLPFILSVIKHAILPACSLILVGFGTWFLGMRALVSNVVTEDYVTYAELAGVKRSRIVFSYVIRNAMVPQLTALAMTLGAVFSGTIITEQVFTYPGLGTLLVSAVNGGDNATVLAVSTVAICAVAVAIFIVDMLHPILDPRVKAE
ncbi:ABC transporter permease [Martelella mediterranea]|uniref:Peptide/nickel transport system permease protein n=1 Tax=Martelella mediterranea TaxID=293089 RepID=A0A4R3NHM0_9HYPH|nr:ABC transporter permease [Martelella mediterranea]TCT32990.1 peptide/nickel transport system permease protein [Martelella mediterranea]